MSPENKIEIIMILIKSSFVIITPSDRLFAETSFSCDCRKLAIYRHTDRIYTSELQLNKANVSDTEALFLDLHLSISDGFIQTKIYDK